MKNKEVVAVLTPPLPAVGFTTTSPAPRGRRPQVPELRVRVEYDLVAYYPGGTSGDGGARYTLAPDSASVGSGGTDCSRGAVRGDAVDIAVSRLTP